MHRNPVAAGAIAILGLGLLFSTLWPSPSSAALADFAGRYRGTYSGDDRGTWQLEIDRAGDLTGSYRSSIYDDSGRITGRVTASGGFSAIAGTVSSGARFSGRIEGDGRISGTWAGDGRGRFEGRRVAEVETVRVRIKARAFIPGVFVQPSNVGRCGGEVVHAGDARIGRRGNARFRARTRQFRMQEVIDVVAEKLGASVAIDVRRAPPQVKRTREFAFDALADGRIDERDVDRARNDCRLLNRQANGSPNRLRVSSQELANGRVRIRIRGGAPNPLASQQQIDWRFDVDLDFTGRQPRYTIGGRHDGFPAFEMYLNNARVYQFDPGPPLDRCGIAVAPIGPLPGYCEEQVSRLQPPMDVAVSGRSGTVGAR